MFCVARQFLSRIYAFYGVKKYGGVPKVTNMRYAWEGITKVYSRSSTGCLLCRGFDASEKPQHMCFCHKIGFIAIYALLGAPAPSKGISKAEFLGILFLGLQVHWVRLV